VNTLTHFQQSLGTELRERAELLSAAPGPARRARPTRRVLLVAATAAAAVAAVVAVPLSTGGGTESAYAVTPHSDGTVSFQLFNPKGAAGLEAALHKLGIRTVAMVTTKGCAEKTPKSDPQIHNVLLLRRGANGAAIELIRPSAVPRGETLLLSVTPLQGSGGAPDGSSRGAIQFLLVRNVPSCIPPIDVGIRIQRSPSR
jgi:hypothetical protein